VVLVLLLAEDHVVEQYSDKDRSLLALLAERAPLTALREGAEEQRVVLDREISWAAEEDRM
jgi:hypothetical protein